MRHAPLIAALLLPFAVGASAQVREQVTVEVVDVPVYVIGNDGKPIRNLEKKDFELFVNGKRQAIDYFDRIDFSAVPAASDESAPAPVQPRERRLFLLLFDLTYSRPSALARAQKAAASMVEHGLANDFFAVATSSARGAKFLIPFTRDRQVVERAIMAQSPSRAHDALAISITDAERQTAETWISPTTGASVSTAAPAGGAGRHGAEDPVPELMAAAAAEEEQRAKNLAESHLSDLAGIASRLASLEGYKHVILFSDGFTSNLIHGELPQPGETGRVPQVDPSMFGAIQAMVRSFHAAGALLHTVDLSTVDAWTFDPAASQSLFIFANETGGRAIHWKNDIKGALADLSSATTAGYRLGFTPVKTRDGENRIDVRVKHVPFGTIVSFRKGFSSSPQRSSGDSLLLADIIQNDVPQSGTAAAMSAEGDRLVVTIPTHDLAWQFGDSKAVLLIYIFDKKGRAVFADSIDVHIASAAREKDDPLVRIPLRAGSYVAKSLLRVGGSTGFSKIAFTIDEPAGAN